jgi:hypothetical protein
MKTHENKKKISEITFEQVRKQTLGLEGPKYDLCKVLGMCS